MSKRNGLIGVGPISDNTFVIHTDHFSVSLTMPEECVREVKCPSSNREDAMINFDYKIIHKTTYTTNFQVKKYLRRFFIDAIKDAIRKEKEI